MQCYLLVVVIRTKPRRLSRKVQRSFFEEDFLPKWTGRSKGCRAGPWANFIEATTGLPGPTEEKLGPSLQTELSGRIERQGGPVTIGVEHRWLHAVGTALDGRGQVLNAVHPLARSGSAGVMT